MYSYILLICSNTIRLSYIVWLLQELVQRIPANVHLKVMYDIACILVQHLRASGSGRHLLFLGGGGSLKVWGGSVSSLPLPPH